jgi:hypothetical protein
MGAQPRHFNPGEGKTYKLGRITLTFKTTAADNGGAYTLCEAIEPPIQVQGFTATRPTTRRISSAQGATIASSATGCSSSGRAT